MQVTNGKIGSIALTLIVSVKRRKDSLALPSAIHLLDDVDFIGNFGAVETYQPSEPVLTQPITQLMRPGTMVQVESGLLRAYALMLQHDLHDLPVVDTVGRLIGIASRVDIGTTILAS